MMTEPEEFNVTKLTTNHDRVMFGLILTQVLDEHSNKYRMQAAQDFLEVAWEEYQKWRGKQEK